jgi:hypothetical protein
MIKLLDLLYEYKSVNGLDKFSTTKDNDIVWVDGDVYVNPFNDVELTMQLGLKTVVILKINTSKRTVTIRDFDDWSSFKEINKHQQAIKDLIRLKMIDDRYMLKITMADVQKNLAVNVPTIKTFLEYDASFSKVIPRAFHGTTTHELENIKRLGILRPSQTDSEILKWSAFYDDQSPDTVYLTIDFSRAEYYANHAVETLKNYHGIKAKPIVIQIDNLPVDAVVADDDFKNNMGMISFLQKMRTGKGSDTYVRSIRGTSQFGYRRRIPPSMITKIHKV